MASVMVEKCFLLKQSISLDPWTLTCHCFMAPLQINRSGALAKRLTIWEGLLQKQSGTQEALCLLEALTSKHPLNFPEEGVVPCSHL